MREFLGWVTMGLVLLGTVVLAFPPVVMKRDVLVHHVGSSGKEEKVRGDQIVCRLHSFPGWKFGGDGNPFYLEEVKSTRTLVPIDLTMYPAVDWQHLMVEITFVLAILSVLGAVRASRSQGGPIVASPPQPTTRSPHLGQARS